MRAEADRINEEQEQAAMASPGLPGGIEDAIPAPPPGTSNTNGLRQGITNDVFNPNPYPGGR